MFVYLSKKIAIPNSTPLRCIAWDQENGYLACGGDEGLLKVLKLDAKAGPSQSSLTINQTLEGHNGSVTGAVWNETNQRLTTSDQNGLIIVWMFVKGQWYEEMINNRNKSVVRGMAWTSDGQKICIVYEDGAVIVGSVDGNRLWGKDLKNSQLVGVVWSPDSKILLFAHSNGEVHVHDSSGLFVSKAAIKAVSDSSHVVAMHWIPCLNHNQAPTLAIGYSNGLIQLLRNENDEEPVTIESGLLLKSLQWNHSGAVLALAGSLSQSNNSSSNCVRFYDPWGNLVYEFKLPGQSLCGVSWEGFSLRLALGVDSYIYLAQVKLDHCWSFFSNTLAYHFTKKGKGERYVMFWDTKNNERYVKQVKDLLGMASNGEHCVLATRLDDTESDETFQSKYGLILCNALGTPVDSKYVQMEPAFVAMTKSYVIASSRQEFMVWHYRTPKSRIGLEFAAVKKDARDQTIRFEEVMPGIDRVCCMCSALNVVVFGTSSGHLLGFTLPSLQFVGHAVLPSRPSKIYMNCSSTKLAVLDTSGILRMLQMDSSSGIPCFGTMLNFERKDVWNLEWASDNTELFAIMEKTRMYVFRNMDPEEPVVSSAYLCSFKDLEIIAVSLDEMVKDPENPSKESLVTMETKSLRDTRNLLDKVGTKEAQLFVEENSHPRLWKLLAEYSLEKLDLEASETSFVRCGDFASLQLLHRLKKLLKDSLLLKAEVAAYFGKFDEAEQMFLAADRRDLALALRRKLGDWSRVADLQKGLAAMTNDLETKSNYEKMGRYYADRYQWSEAAKYFEQSDSSERLVDCYLHLEDYESLEKLSLRLNENDPLLAKIAGHLAAVGLCDLAVQSYLKCHQAKLALETCCMLNQWNSAVTLAKQVQLPGIASRLAAHTHRVLEQHRLTEAVQLLRKSNCFAEAATLLYQEAEKQLQKKCDPLKMKKLFVLAALLADEQKLHPQEGFSFVQNKSSRFLDAPWRGAEAFHIFLIAQRHLGRGSAAAAMGAAYKLQDYADILDPEMIYSLLALSSAANKCFGTCSKAFIRLESLSQLGTTEREMYSLLAVDIFMRNPPKDGRQNRNECPQCHSSIYTWMPMCLECGVRFPTCMVTGQPLQNSASVWNCKTCKRSAAEHEMITRISCPLCHSPVQGL